MASLTKSPDKTEGQTSCFVPSKHPLLGQLPLYVPSVYILSCLERMVVEGATPEQVLEIAKELHDDEDLMRFFHQALKEDGSLIETVDDYELLKEFYASQPSWWETNVEDRAAAFFDKQREGIPEGWDRTTFDIEMGIWKGIYTFGKGTILGIWELVKLIAKLFYDSKTQEQVGNFMKDVAWYAVVFQFGTLEMKKQAAQKVAKTLKQLFDAVAQQVAKEWDEAEKTGKRDELVAKWVTTGVLEIATIALAWLKGAKAARSATALAKAAEGVSTGTKIARNAKTFREVILDVREILAMHVDDFAKAPAKVQRRLFVAAKHVRNRMLKDVTDALQGINADIASILKRDKLSDFTEGVIKKNRRSDKAGKYENIGYMEDMARGRVSVDTLDDMEKVKLRLKDKFGDKIAFESSPKNPRVHATIDDVTTGMKYELQIGTRATTELLEKTPISLPESLAGKLGRHDFHDVYYDHVSKLLKPQHSAIARKLHLRRFHNSYMKLLMETQKSVPVGFKTRAAKHARTLSKIVHKIEEQMPGLIQSLGEK